MGYLGYSKGDSITLVAPSSINSSRFTSGRSYKGIVEVAELFNLGIYVVDNFGERLFTAAVRPACFQRKVDWIIVDEYLENLRKVLE